MTENYLTRYCTLCETIASEQRKGAKMNVKKHNTARLALNKLALELSQNEIVAKDVFFMLLKECNIRVRLSAAAHSLKYGIHAEEAICVLENIEKDNDAYAAFSAMMVLKVYRGEIAGRQL